MKKTNYPLHSYRPVKYVPDLDWTIPLWIFRGERVNNTEMDQYFGV